MNPRSWEQMVSSTKVAKWNLGCKLLPWRRLRLVHPRAFLSYNVQDQEESEPSCILPKLWEDAIDAIHFYLQSAHLFIYSTGLCQGSQQSDIDNAPLKARDSLKEREAKERSMVRQLSLQGCVGQGLEWISGCVLSLVVMSVSSWAFNYSKPSLVSALTVTWYLWYYCSGVGCMHLLATTCMPHQVHRPAWLP